NVTMKVHTPSHQESISRVSLLWTLKSVESATSVASDDLCRYPEGRKLRTLVKNSPAFLRINEKDSGPSRRSIFFAFEGVGPCASLVRPYVGRGNWTGDGSGAIVDGHGSPRH